MRQAAALFAMIAMVPAGVLAAVPARSGTLVVPLCAGDGAARTIAIPLAPDGVPGGAPGKGDTPCCAKGCHTGSSRKRGCC
jgi:hypothetical protein